VHLSYILTSYAVVCSAMMRFVAILPGISHHNVWEMLIRELFVLSILDVLVNFIARSVSPDRYH
jgi:hypothetical protein